MLRSVLALLLLAACSAPSVVSAPHRSPKAAAVAAEREAVERGLLPAVVLAGRPVPAWSVEERMRRYRVPGLGVAVIRGGEVAWAGGYGVTRAGREGAVTAATRFQAASISKAVTAAAALRLVQEGRIGLEEDIRPRLRGWRIPFAEGVAPAPVTLRQLLSHTGGVSVSGFPGYPRGAPRPTLHQLLDAAPPAVSPPVRVVTAPGEGFRYSGGGYQIVELLLEEVTGRPFAELVDDLVLAPAGMRQSTFAQPLPAALETSAAHGHGFDGAPVPEGWHVYPEHAAAGLWSTPADLARFAAELARAFRGESDRLLTPEMARRMLTAETEVMGLGIGVHGSGDALHFDHAGWNRGMRSYLVAYPATGEGIAVMTNGDGGHELIAEVVRAAARVYGWPGFAPERREPATLDPATLEALAGRWNLHPAGFAVTLTRRNDHLVLATPRGSWYTLHAAGAGELFALENGMTIRVSRDDDGPALHLWGSVARLASVPPEDR